MAGARIQLKRATASAWAAANTVLFAGEIGYETDTNKFKIGDGTTAFNSLPYFNGNLAGSNLNDLADVTIVSAADGDFLRWNGTAWINDAVNLSTDTIGSYVESLVAGTGVSLENNSGEGATPTIAIGQAVSTSSSVTFGHVSAPVTGNVTGDLTGNADTATALETARTISLSGDLSGSVSFDGSSDVTITATVQPDSVALGTDTTGNFMSDVVAGTGVTVTHTPGESSSASIAIGQDVATSASVTFAKVETTGDVTVGGNLTVNGTTTTLNTETLAIEDNIVTLNSNVTGSPSLNAGIEVERGDSANVVLRWNESTDKWETTNDGSAYSVIATNGNIALGTDTTGNYMSDVTASTGVTISHTPGEGSTATFSIGQSVDTSASVTFANVSADLVGNVTGNLTGDVTGNADTATTLENARTISLGGDVSGSVSFNGSSDVSISTTIQPNSVALGTDTTGDYVSSLVAGTNIAITNNSGEGATPTISVSGSVSSVDSISSPDFIQFDTTANTTPVAGLLGWDSTQGTLNLGLTATKHIHIGEESLFRVRNSTGTTIGKGTALYASGVEPSGRIQVTPYVADGTIREVRFMGLASESIADGVNGFVQHFGHIRDLDTRGTSSTAISVGDETWAAGDILYVHPTVPGKLTNVEPRHAIVVALVIVRHESTGWLFVRPSSGGHIEDIHDIVLTSPTDGQFLRYNSASTVWVNDTINLGTDTDGDYVQSLVAGTGVTLSNNSGETATPTVAIGQDVATSASVEFAALTVNGQTEVGGHILPDATETYDLGSESARFRDIYLSGTSINLGGAEITSDGTSISFAGGLTGDVTGNADTASTLETARTISLGGDLSGSVSFDGSTDVTITATVQPDSVALGTDTTGNYVNDLTAGTGVTITHTPGEGSSPTVAIGQSVATSASVTFAKVDTTGDVVVGGNLTVNGTTTTLNTETLSIEDNIVVLNSNVSGSPTTNAGIEVERGSSENVVLRWNESLDKWEITEDGSTYSGIVTSSYLESRLFDDHIHPSVRVAQGDEFSGSVVYTNGSLDLDGGYGIGATLENTVNGALVVDNFYNSEIGDRVLVLNQADEIRNGIYTVTNVGSESEKWKLTRASDFDGSFANSITPGEMVFSFEGDVYGGHTYVVESYGTGPARAHIIGTDNITIAQADGTQNLIEGDGIQFSGNAIGLSAVAGSVISGPESRSFLRSLSLDGYGRVTSVTESEVGTTILGVHTSGDYVSMLDAGTGIFLASNSGASAMPSISIGQDVSQSASVEFARVYGTSVVGQTISASVFVGELNGNSSTATKLAAPQNIAGQAFDGSTPISIAPTDLTGVTATAAEINTLDGILASTSELNILYGVIADASEINILNGVTSSTAELNILDGVTASTSEINILDGVTSSTSELNILDGVTATAAELNILAGATLSTTELNYVDGVTSAIQTQLDNKASATTSPVITLGGDLSGSVTLTNLTSGTLTATIQPNSVALGTDTSGDYVSSLVAGTGLTITNNSGETATPTVAIGQDVATTASVTFANVTISNPPTVSSHAATKEYVDEVAQGLQAKPAVKAASTANISGTYENGTLGVGATLTSTTNGQFPEIDGVSNWEQYDGILLKNQTDKAENGRWVVYVVGDAGTPWQLMRCGLCDEVTEIPGAYIFVFGGTVNVNNGYVLSVDDPDTFTVGTDDIDVIQFSGAGSVLAGLGIFKDGNTLSIGQDVSASVSPSFASMTLSVSTGTAPLSVSSSTVVTNLNADLLDGQDGSYYAPLNSPTFAGTVTLPTGTVTSGMILDETIVNGDISSSAAIDLGKLADVSTNAQVGSYTLALSDKNKIVEIANGSANTLTIPLNSSVAFPVGSQITFIQTGAGQTTITPTGGVTVNGTPGLKLRAQWSSATLIKRATDTWVALGDLSA